MTIGQGEVHGELGWDARAVVYGLPAAAARAAAPGRRGAVVRRALLRRRIVAFVMLCGLGGGVGHLLLDHGAGDLSRSIAPRSVVLHGGQTLWGLAERYRRPGVDPRSYVDAIVRANHIHSEPIAGIRLRLPP